MVSSSCSYAASAMAKSLFVKGADYIAAMVFMFASTNLVIELGIVLIVLMGWQFAVSEFVGGIIMIVLLATFGALWLRGRLVVQARERLEATEDGARAPARSARRTTRPASLPLKVRLRSMAGWADSATYTMSDLTMLRRELVIGYTVAGFLAVLVPTSVWQAVFITGHGFWTSVENAIVGPFIAIISFVCSIGNVPLAAALWSGGISFGGVIAFIFADLIAFPLLLIYRRYYGTRLMLRMLAVFWALMSTAGLLTELLFRAAGLVPTMRPTTIAPAHFSWNYTTYLNLIFLALFGVLYWLYRNRERLGGGRPLRAGPGLRHAGREGARPGVAPTSRRALLLLLRPLRGALRCRRATTRAHADRGRQEHTMQHERIIEQLDQHGRLRPDHSGGGGPACGPPAGTTEFDAVHGRPSGPVTRRPIRTPRSRPGTMSQEDADAALDRVRHGRAPGELRRRIRGTG